MNDDNKATLDEGGNVPVCTWMDSPATTIFSDATLSEVLSQKEETGATRFVVINKKGLVVGMVTELDLKRTLPSPVTSLDRWELGYMLGHIQLKDMMTRPVLTVTPDTAVARAIGLMTEHNISGLPVVNHNGKVVGMVTMKKIVQALLDRLEQCGCFFNRKGNGGRGYAVCAERCC